MRCVCCLWACWVRWSVVALHVNHVWSHELASGLYWHDGADDDEWWRATDVTDRCLAALRMRRPDPTGLCIAINATGVCRYLRSLYTVCMLRHVWTSFVIHHLNNQLHRLTERDSILLAHYFGVWGYFWATSGAKSDVVFLLGDPDFLWRRWNSRLSRLVFEIWRGTDRRQTRRPKQ